MLGEKEKLGCKAGPAAESVVDCWYKGLMKMSQKRREIFSKPPDVVELAKQPKTVEKEWCMGML